MPIPVNFHVAITPAGMRAYLAERGWRAVTERDSPKYQIWRDDRQGADVLVPSGTQYRDWPQRAMDLIRACAELESRDLIAVWEDLAAASRR